MDYRDGTVAPPTILPPMPDHCDLVLQIDNVTPTLTLDVPKAGSECGVVKYTDVPFVIQPSVTQANGRLYWWGLRYVKGLSGVELNVVPNESSPAGLSPLPATTAGTSNRFDTVYGWAHHHLRLLTHRGHVARVRNGYGQIYYQRLIKAIAVERCS